MKCGRCDYEADNLTEHAFASGHLLCIVCQRKSLTEFEAQTCAACVGRVRADLADIANGWSLLEPNGLAAMTLLGDGTMQRHAHGYELVSLTPTPHPLDHDRHATAKPIRDEWASDPLPIVAALASWEDFWRADYNDPTGPPATLHGVIDYLTRHLDTGHRAAQTHPAFDEFAAAVHQLRLDVRHAAGLADVPLEADAQCFDCGGDLLRTYRDLTEPAEARRARGRRAVQRALEPTRRQRKAERSYGIRDVTPWPPSALDLWRRIVAGTTGEGLTDEWTCARCRREYDQASYFLALRSASSLWVRVPVAAETAQRPVRTVRSWALRGLVTVACRVTDRAIVVWWPDVSDRAFRHEERESA